MKGGTKHAKYSEDHVPHQDDLSEEQLKEMQEKARMEAELDADGQPLYKEIRK